MIYRYIICNIFRQDIRLRVFAVFSHWGSGWITKALRACFSNNHDKLDYSYEIRKPTKV